MWFRSELVNGGTEVTPPPRALSNTRTALPLPQEILDLIIDHLHDEPATLKACCLVSKAWVPRARKYLFVQVVFDAFDWPVSRWRETFPDPTSSPAHNVRALSIRYPTCIATGNTDTFLTFCNVIHLNVDTSMYGNKIHLVPLHGISTAVRSLRLVSSSLPDSEIFGLICSFPLLEDLALVSCAPRPSETWTGPRTSPRLTGSLELYANEGIQTVTRRLLDLPNGLHFKRIVVRPLSSQDIGSATDLVSRCSDTLESLSIVYPLSDASPSIDLSKATKLRDVEFVCVATGVQWVTMALRTAESKSIHQISIGLSRGAFLQLSRQECSDLDPLLVHLWTIHPLRLKVTHELMGVPGGVVAHLLPEIARRGVIATVECPCVPPSFLSLGTTFW